MKKGLSMMLAAAMVIGSLTACGGSSSTTTETKAANAGAAASTDGDVFLIGGIGPLTGAAASYGLSVKNGAQVAINEINEAGGVAVGDKTYTLDMAFEDDEATAEKAISAYSSLMDKNINALMGAVTSGSCIGIADQTAADGILQITPSGSAEECIKNDNAFRICFADPEQGTKMADLAVTDLGYSKIAVLYNSDSDYSTGIQEAFEAEVAAKGGEIVASEAFAEGTNDFNTQLTKIKGTNPEVIFVPAYYQDATYITKQAKEQGMEVPFLGSDGWDGVLGTVTDAATVEGAIFSSPFCAAVEDANVVKFVEAYGKLADGAVPDQFAADAYDAVYAIKAAMEKAGSIESADLIAAMTSINVDGLTGSITFDKNGAPIKEVKYIEIKDAGYTIK